MFPAAFISGSRDFTQHLTSDELILTRVSWCRLRARVQPKALSSLLEEARKGFSLLARAIYTKIHASAE